MMNANTYDTQQALAQDQKFLVRVRAALLTVAWKVLEESTSTVGHQGRAAYARKILENPPVFTQTVSQWIVMRPNLNGPFVTSYDFAIGAVVTTASDADLESQIATDWTHMSGA